MRYDKKIQHLIISMLLTLTAGFAVADDTEVYLAAPSQSAVLPNVLFMLDTSSSMTTTDDGQTENRLELMKDALRTVIGSANNVKMGLMRFHKEGGPVLYPVSDINAPAESTAGGAGDVVSIISSSSDDAEQLTASGSVSLDSAQLAMTTSLGSIVTEEYSVTNGNDDAEERDSGAMYMTSSDLELMTDGGQQKIGIRFRGTDIPAGATILSAEIEFQIKDQASGNDDPIEIQINGHKVTNSAAFNSSNNDISDRIASATLASVIWNPDPDLNTGELFSTPDLSALLQEMVDQAGWRTNSAATFLFQRVSGSGVRRAWSNDGTGTAPKLKVSYSTDAGGGDQTVGLRFRNIMVPKGATITNAVLEFEAASTLSESASFLIAAEDGDNPDTFAASLNNISSRTLTSARVAWGDVTVGVEPWVSGQRFQSPDISSIVQEVVNRDGWCGGNAMVITLTGVANALRTATAYDGSASAAPALRLSYNPDTLPTDTCINQQIQAAVNSSNSDAEESAGNSMNLTNSDLEMVEGDGSEQTIGIRFDNIRIPKDATIISADIVFTVDETSSGATSLTIHGEAVDDSLVFTNTTNNISNRTTTTASTSWAATAWNTEGEQHASPDLSSIVAEITARSGWAAGNAMTFIISGSGARIAESYDGNAAAAPRLRIKIQGGQGESGLQVQTVRDKLIEVVDNLNWKGGTPILDVMYEAARYYRGEPVYYGRTRGFGFERAYSSGGEWTLGEGSQSRNEYTRVSTPLSWTGGTLVQPAGCSDDSPNSTDCIDEHIEGEATYISPVTEHCQASYQILLSDGEGYRTNSVDLVRTMIDNQASNCSGHDGCAEDLSGFLHTEDQTDLTNDQNVTTHTIGFALDGDPQFLRDIASAGGGSFFEASSSAGLVETFQTILSDVLTRTTSFTAAAVSVNQFNKLSHDDDIYFSTFEPGEAYL